MLITLSVLTHGGAPMSIRRWSSARCLSKQKRENQITPCMWSGSSSEAFAMWWWSFCFQSLPQTLSLLRASEWGPAGPQSVSEFGPQWIAAAIATPTLPKQLRSCFPMLVPGHHDWDLPSRAQRRLCRMDAQTPECPAVFCLAKILPCLFPWLRCVVQVGTIRLCEDHAYPVQGSLLSDRLTKRTVLQATNAPSKKDFMYS